MQYNSFKGIKDDEEISSSFCSEIYILKNPSLFLLFLCYNKDIN